MCEHHLSIKCTNTNFCVTLSINVSRVYQSKVYIPSISVNSRYKVKIIKRSSFCQDNIIIHNSKSFVFQLQASSHLILVTSGVELEVIRKACECDFVVKRQQTEFSYAYSESFVVCAAAV